MEMKDAMVAGWILLSNTQEIMDFKLILILAKVRVVRPLLEEGTRFLAILMFRAALTWKML